MGVKVADRFSSRRRVASGKLRHVAALQIGVAPCRRWQARSLLVAVGGLLKVACFLWKQMGKPKKTVSCRVAGMMQGPFHRQSAAAPPLLPQEAGHYTQDTGHYRMSLYE